MMQKVLNKGNLLNGPTRPSKPNGKLLPIFREPKLVPFRCSQALLPCCSCRLSCCFLVLPPAPSLTRSKRPRSLAQTKTAAKDFEFGVYIYRAQRMNYILVSSSNNRLIFFQNTPFPLIYSPS